MALSTWDLVDLERFFALGYHEKSTMGPQLERVWLFAIEQSVTVDESKLTARPTAETIIHAKADPYADHIDFLTRVHGRLGELSGRQRAVLEAYHGDKGSLCQHKLKRGRIVALFDRTPAGKLLLRRERARDEAHGSQLELMQRAVARADAGQDVDVKAHVAVAYRQAVALRDDAEDAYTAASQRAQARKRVPQPFQVVSREMRDEDL